MGLKDKISTKFKNWGSKRTENSNVRDLEDAIKQEEEKINIKIADIGEYYWNLFSKNAFVPDNEAMEMFRAIVASQEKIDSLKVEIEETRKSGNMERDQNIHDLAEKEKHDAELAEQRRIEKERYEAELAAERKRQKDAQAELDKMKNERSGWDDEKGQ